MRSMRKGRWLLRLAASPDDLLAAQRLRWLCFGGDRTGSQDSLAVDADALDAVCQHVLIEDTRSGQLVACFRLLHLASGADIDRSYSAQYYNLSALRDFPAPMVELGRFCVHPARSDPDILRLAWAALTQHVDEAGVELLFGCSSFLGTDATQHEDAFGNQVWVIEHERVERALELLRPHPAMAQAREETLAVGRRATDSLAGLPESDAKTALVALMEGVVHRVG